MQMRHFLFFFAVLLSLPGLVWAQSGKGNISGQVRLADGSPAANVSVLLEGTNKGELSSETGHFALRHVSIGKHQLRVSFTGFEPTIVPVEVVPGENNIGTIQLKISKQELSEITVRAGLIQKGEKVSSSLRLQEPLQELPQNIQIISSKTLASQQVTSLSDGVLRNVSGLTQLEHWGDMYTRINTRGARAAAFRDGMNVSSNWGPLTEDMSFVEQIEFVKGPSGFMMSTGEPSGIYNVVTKRPTGTKKGEVGLLLGSYDFYRATVDLDGQFDKKGKVLYRLNLMDQTKGSFRPYEYNDRYSIAPVITYKIDDKTSFTASYIMQHARMSNVGSYYAYSTEGYGNLPRDFTTADPNLAPTVINDHNLTLNFQHQFNKNWNLTAQLSYFNYQQQGASMWPSYIDSTGNMIRYVSIWDASNISKFGQVYLNGQIQTGSVQHRVLAGLDLGDKTYMADWNQQHDLDSVGAYFNTHHPSYGSPVTGYPKFDRSKSLAERAGIYGTLAQRYTGLYVQDELGFWDNTVRLTLAGRYTTDVENSYGTIMEASKFTPRIGLSITADKSLSFYGLYDQSFLPQSGIRRDGNKVLPLTGNNIEFGAKKEWFGGRWNSTLSVYRILNNNQVSADPANSSSENFVVQFGQTQTQGLELDIQGNILPGLSLIANYAYTDAKITKADSSEASQSTIGNRVPGYSTHVANAWLTYRLNDGFFKGLSISLGGNFQGDRSTWSWGEAGQKNLPDYFRMDAGLSYEVGKFTITANVFNVLNTYLYSGSYYGYGGFYYWQTEAGRNQRIGINYRF